MLGCSIVHKGPTKNKNGTETCKNNVQIYKQNITILVWTQILINLTHINFACHC